jgi:hypothetical protein
MVDKDIQSIIKRHIKYIESKIHVDGSIPDDIPFLYWIPKMHKKPFSKQRYIAASHYCSTKPLSALLTKCFALIEKEHRKMCHRYYISNGINPMWIINNSDAIHDLIRTFNKEGCNNIRTYDFSTLYTSIPHKLLKSQLSWVITEAFKSSEKKYISVYKNQAKWTNSPRSDTNAFDCKEVTNLMRWLIDNIYVKFGDKVFKQVIGIPMGTDCAPYLANLFLYSFEYKWIEQQRKDGRQDLLNLFKGCCRYIDDLGLINNNDEMMEAMSEIYPSELELVPDDSDGMTTTILDLMLTIRDNNISTSIYDKRDAFDFPIVNFPNLSGNIPTKSAYGVFSGELVRYARGCDHLNDFSGRLQILVTKLLSQNFTDILLKRTFTKFCDSHIFKIQKYGSDVLNIF